MKKTKLEEEEEKGERWRGGGDEGEKIYKSQALGVLEVSNSFHSLIFPSNPRLLSNPSSH